MCEVVKVLERELENSGLIYVYQEGGEGKWYVYERSAYFLSRMMEGVVLERYVMDILYGLFVRKWMLTAYLMIRFSVTAIKSMC